MDANIPALVLLDGGDGSVLGSRELAAGGLCLDPAGRVYATVYTDGSLERFDDLSDPDPEVLEPDKDLFHYAAHVFVDAAGRIYVWDGASQAVVRFDDMDGAGRVTLEVPVPQVFDLFVSPAGRIYLMEPYRVRSYDDMTGSNPQELDLCFSATGLFVDADGRLYLGCGGGIPDGTSVDPAIVRFDGKPIPSTCRRPGLRRCSRTRTGGSTGPTTAGSGARTT